MSVDGVNSIQNKVWQDDPSYFFCFGNQLIQNGDNTTAKTSGTTPFSGYIRSFTAGAGRINSTSEVNTKYQCGGCAGNCTMCDPSGICPFGVSNPEFLIYDFTEGSMLGGSSWVGT